MLIVFFSIYIRRKKLGHMIYPYNVPDKLVSLSHRILIQNLLVSIWKMSSFTTTSHGCVSSLHFGLKFHFSADIWGSSMPTLLLFIIRISISVSDIPYILMVQPTTIQSLNHVMKLSHQIIDIGDQDPLIIVGWISLHRGTVSGWLLLPHCCRHRHHSSHSHQEEVEVIIIIKKSQA